MSDLFKKKSSIDDLLRKAPSMTMEELEAKCSKNAEASEEVKKAMNAFDKAFPEESISFWNKLCSTGKAVGAKALDLITNEKFGVGFFVGMFYILIACGLTHGKKWERIDE